MSGKDVPVLGAATLQKIVPLAVRQTVDDISATVTSLERYAEGFVINVRLDWEGRSGQIPRLTWHVSDEHGGVYRCIAGCGGTGGGPRPETEPSPNTLWQHSWRMTCSFYPGIDSKARQLTLSLQKMTLTGAIVADQDPLNISREESTREVAGLGEFVVALD